MLNVLKACYDWRVVSALAAVGVGVALFAPDLVALALPLLIVAACPISMALMMRTMGPGHDTTRGSVALELAERADLLRAELAASRRQQERLEAELAGLDAPRAPTGSTSATTSPSGRTHAS